MEHDKARTEKSRELVEDWLSSKRNDTDRVDRALEYMQNPRYDKILGYTPALQDIWDILNRENN